MDINNTKNGLKTVKIWAIQGVRAFDLQRKLDF
jgi:hypothetical protein